MDGNAERLGVSEATMAELMRIADAAAKGLNQSPDWVLGWIEQATKERLARSESEVAGLKAGKMMLEEALQRARKALAEGDGGGSRKTAIAEIDIAMKVAGTSKRAIADIDESGRTQFSSASDHMGRKFGIGDIVEVSGGAICYNELESHLPIAIQEKIPSFTEIKVERILRTGKRMNVEGIRLDNGKRVRVYAMDVNLKRKGQDS